MQFTSLKNNFLRSLEASFYFCTKKLKNEQVCTMASSSQQAPVTATAAMGQSQFDIWHKEITEEIYALDLEEDVTKRIVLADLVSSHRKFVHHLVNKYEYLNSKSEGQEPNKVLVISKIAKPAHYQQHMDRTFDQKKFVYPNGTTDDRLIFFDDDKEHGGKFYNHKYNGQLAYVAKGCHHPVYIGESCMDSAKMNAGGSADIMMADASNSGLRGKVDGKTAITHKSHQGETVTYPSCGCKVLYRNTGEAQFITQPPSAGHVHAHPENPNWTTEGSDGKGKGKGKGAKGGKHGRTREEQLSRMLSSLLRHRAADLGLEVGADGYAALQHVLKLSQFRKYAPTVEEIKAYVESNTKKRFTLIDRAPPASAYSLWYIKANQGHTMKIVDDDALLTEIKEGELEVCCHGTFERLWFWKK